MIVWWQRSIANADFADWLTVTAYLLAAILCARAAAHAGRSRQFRDRFFWLGVAVLLVLLGFNELLDLQTLLTSAGRAYAEASGWYAKRRSVQAIFVVTLGAATLFASMAILWITRRSPAAVRVACLGVGFIGLFVLVRAISFHHVDELLGRGARILNYGSVQELTGIFIVAGAALLYVGKRANLACAHARKDAAGLSTSGVRDLPDKGSIRQSRK